MNDDGDVQPMIILVTSDHPDRAPAPAGTPAVAILPTAGTKSAAVEIFERMAALWPGLTWTQVAEIGTALTSPSGRRAIDDEQMARAIHAELERKLGPPTGRAS